MKICWISNTPAPYKVEFMNYLGKQSELYCMFEARSYSHREQSWYNYDFDHFTAEYLDDNKAKKAIRNAAEQYDVLISSDYSHKYCRYAVRQFRKKSKTTWMLVDGGLAVPRGLLDLVISHEMKRYDRFLSSGDAVNEKYFDYYGIDRTRICNYHLACMSTAEIEQCASMKKNRDDYRKELGLPDHTILLSVGQQVPRKGFDVLVKTMKGIKSRADLYIIGGEPQKEVKEFVEQNELSNIHFIPFLNKDGLAKYYAASDMFVLPTRYDIWGLVINEAMAYGLPLISTDHCMAAVEMEKKFGCAVTVPTDDDERLLEAILDLINDPLRQKELSGKALKAVKHYTYEKMTQDFLMYLTEKQ
ncbi:MAG: glycosyltransferase family 4 protein [Solobacterium sp.]|nr:glycosyltransferase family 4 protein [Solobacterium sp.]